MRICGPKGSYAVWENGRFTLRTVEYPVERTLEKLAAQSLAPEIVAALSQALTTGTAPETTAWSESAERRP